MNKKNFFIGLEYFLYKNKISISHQINERIYIENLNEFISKISDFLISQPYFQLKNIRKNVSIIELIIYQNNEFICKIIDDKYFETYELEMKEMKEIDDLDKNIEKLIKLFGE